MGDEAQPRAHSDADARRRALELALRMLNARERTEAELRTSLERRRFESDVVGDVVGTLVAEGLIDDASYVRRFVDDRRLLDGWGTERIARDLDRRGIKRELVDEALVGHGHQEELAYSAVRAHERGLADAA